MEQHSSRPSPFGHSLEAYSPAKASPVAPHPHAPESSPGLLKVACSCGCCGHEQEAQNKGKPRSKMPQWLKLGLAGLFAVLSEALHYAEEGSFLEEIDLLGIIPVCFALLAIALSGVQTFKAGWASLRRLEFNMAALMSVAVTGAVLIGEFPEAAMVMVLFQVSEAIEERVIEKARRAIRDLLALSPERALVRQSDGSWLEMESRLVPIGALVRVKPGERIALDGVVREGRSSVDQSPITGESMPVEKGVGDSVFAGTINTSGSFDFEVTDVASNTTLARIIHAVEKAQASRAPIQRFVDSFARFYTPCIFAASLLIALVPPLFFGAEWLGSIYTALVVLVIGCPCALVISTPVTILSGMAAATRLGMLVKGGAFLEQGRLLRVLALDKTGTLTHGKPVLTDIVPASGRSEDCPRLLSLAASLASRSDHPVSLALTATAREAGAELAEIADVEAVAGQGIRVMCKGERLSLGSMRMMEEGGLLSPHAGQELSHRAAELEAQGRTVVALADGGRVLALFAVADTIRESSVQAMRELRELGVKTVMLTGDNEAAARHIAEQAGVDEYHARLLPEDKLAVVESLVASRQGGSGQRGIESSRGKVGMAGDGINDAPALARADIGFAMAGSGTDTALETADVALMDDDLRKIPRFVRLSRRVHGILIQNMALALGVKALFFALTLAGHTSMWMAVFADVGTALMVVGNGLRAGRR